MAEKKSENELTCKDIEPGAVITEPGSACQYKTGAWRTKRPVFDKEKCISCPLNTLCGGGCVVQKDYYPNFDCRKYAASIVNEFINLMKDKILATSLPDRIVSINQLWSIN